MSRTSKVSKTQKGTYDVILSYADTPMNESFTVERQLTVDQGLSEASLMSGEDKRNVENLVMGICFCQSEKYSY